MEQTTQTYKPISVQVIKLFNCVEPTNSERYIDINEPGFKEGVQFAKKIGRSILFSKETSSFNHLTHEEREIKLKKIENTPLSLKELAHMNQEWLYEKSPGIFGYSDSPHNETLIIRKKLSELITPFSFTGDSEPFLHYKKTSYIQKPYVLLRIFALGYEDLINKIKKININMININNKSKFKVGVVNYEWKELYCDQLLTIPTYFTELMFCTILPKNDSSSFEWISFFEFCIDDWWKLVKKIIRV